MLKVIGAGGWIISGIGASHGSCGGATVFPLSMYRWIRRMLGYLVAPTNVWTGDDRWLPHGYSALTYHVPTEFDNQVTMYVSSFL